MAKASLYFVIAFPFFLSERAFHPRSKGGCHGFARYLATIKIFYIKTLSKKKQINKFDCAECFWPKKFGYGRLQRLFHLRVSGSNLHDRTGIQVAGYRYEVRALGSVIEVKRIEGTTFDSKEAAGAARPGTVQGLGLKNKVGMHRRSDLIVASFSSILHAFCRALDGDRPRIVSEIGSRSWQRLLIQ
jgi:hypothetical protein